MTKHRLWGWGTFDEGKSAILALTFGKLHKLAKNDVIHYESDFFHDAVWMNENVTGPTTFYFSWGESGTGIGTSAELVGQIRDNMVKVTIVGEDRVYGSERVVSSDPTTHLEWSAIIEPVKGNVRHD